MIAVFYYEKDSTRKTYVVKKQKEDSVYLHGIDLADKQYKTFLRSKITQLDEYDLDGMNLEYCTVYTGPQLLESMGFTPLTYALLSKLGVQPAKLAETIGEVTGDRVVYCPTGKLFLVCESPYYNLEFELSGDKYAMEITPRELIFRYNDHSMTVEEFISHVYRDFK